MQPLLGGPRAGLVAADVAESLSLVRGAQVRHGLDVLDLTDTPTTEILPFAAGSVTWSYRPPDPLAGQANAVTAVRRSATLDVPGVVTVNLFARRLRLWTEMRLASGGWARWYLGVFAATSPKLDDDGTVLRRSLTLADKSYLWSQTLLVDPVHLDATTVAVAWVQADLASRFGESRFAIAAGVDQVGGAGLTFDSGVDCLTMYSSVLGAVGYDQLTTDETGAPASQPLAALAGRGVEEIYGAGQRKIVPAGSVEPLLPSLPNVIRFVARQGPASGGSEGNGIYTVRNQSTGPASIDSRGAQVSLTVQVDAVDQPTLVAVGDAEKQRYFAGGGVRFAGSVGLNPRHADRDVISILLPRLSMTDPGAWLVTDWTYPLGDLSQSSSAVMSITAEKRVP